MRRSARPRILLVPLLAFDRQGRRLGYGAGYYDLVLRELRALGPPPLAIGVAFAAQEVDAGARRVRAISHSMPWSPNAPSIAAAARLDRRARDGARMRLLFCGDVVGRAGRKVLLEQLRPSSGASSPSMP